MGVYRVKSIKHTGTMGERGCERQDDLYPERKLRILLVDENRITKGERLFVECLGNFMKSMITSPVVDYRIYGNRLTIETENSVYRLERLHE